MLKRCQDTIYLCHHTESCPNLAPFTTVNERGILKMKFSTAKWLSIILSILAVSTFCLFFYMRDVHTLPFLFEISFKWIISFTLLPVIIIIMARMLAEREKKEMSAPEDNEYTIKKKHFKKSILITSGLLQ